MRNIKDFQARYNRWKKGERYWDIRSIDLPRYDGADKNTNLTSLIYLNEDGSYYAASTPSSYTEDVTPLILRNLSDLSTWDFIGSNSGKHYTTQYTDDYLRMIALNSMPNDEMIPWVDRAGNKHRSMRIPMLPLSTDEVYTQMLNNPIYTPSMAQLANYWNYNRTRDYLDYAEDHPIKISMPAYKPGKTGNNPMSTFINDFAQKVYSGLKARNVKNIDNAYNYVMRLMAMESGYANAKSRKYHNYGGIKKGNALKMFKDDDSFLDYYLNLVNSKYNTAINAKDLRGYVNEMGRIGYYGEESPISYYNKINGLKSFGRLLDADLAKNKSIYNQASGIQIDPNTNQVTFVQPVPANQHPAAIPFDSNHDLKTLRFPIPQLELNPTLKLPQLQPEPYDIQYYHGKSGIHINPNNRGKFNATKKRTGKTTEELSHSKNPLTRKRAIFAMNARKWKH